MPTQAVLLQVGFRKPSGRRTVRMDNLHVHTEHPHCSVQKQPLHLEIDLFDTDHLRDIRRLDDAFRRFLRSRSLPDPSLKRGTYLIPKRHWDEVEEEWRRFAQKRHGLVNDFLAAYQSGPTSAFVERIGLDEERDHFEEVFGDFFKRHPDFKRALDGYSGAVGNGKTDLHLAGDPPTVNELEGAFSEDWICREVVLPEEPPTAGP